MFIFQFQWLWMIKSRGVNFDEKVCLVRLYFLVRSYYLRKENTELYFCRGESLQRKNLIRNIKKPKAKTEIPAITSIFLFFFSSLVRGLIFPSFLNFVSID